MFLASAVAIALLIAAVLAPKEPLGFAPSIDLKFGLLCLGYAFWGITQASNPIVESILADSVPTGTSTLSQRIACNLHLLAFSLSHESSDVSESHAALAAAWDVAGGRSAVYTSLFFLGMLGRAVGPLMAAVIFIVSHSHPPILHSRMDVVC